jgi:hypothetical protein
MTRTLYAWVDNAKFYLSAFPPVDHAVLNDAAMAAQLTEAAKYRPAMEFADKIKLYAEVARRAGGGRTPAVNLKWDEGAEPDGA